MNFFVHPRLRQSPRESLVRFFMLIAAGYAKVGRGSRLALGCGKDFGRVIAFESRIINGSGSKPIRDTTGKVGDCHGEIGASGDHIGIGSRGHAIIDVVVDDDVGSRGLIPCQRDTGGWGGCAAYGESRNDNEGEKGEDCS